MKLISKTLCFSLLSFLAINVVAQDSDAGTDLKESTGHWDFTVTLSHYSLKEDIAIKEGIESDAVAIGLTADFYQGMWKSTLFGDIVVYDDNESFTVRTENVFGGDESDETSTASAIVIGAASGPIKYFGEENAYAVFAQAGFDFVFGSDRSVSGCSDCPSQDIDIKGGLLVRLGAQANVNNLSLGLNFSSHLNDEGLENVVGLAIGSKF